MNLAMRGSQNITGKVEKIDDQEVLAQVRRQAWKVNTRSIVVGIILTLIVLVIP